MRPQPRRWRARGLDLDLSRRVAVMGILNVTPDSFSDGGRFLDTEAAVRRGLELAAQGADIIDVGGESTRPGAQAVDATEQIERVAPVIAALARQLEQPISVDTCDSAVARAALEAGALIVNDVSALRGDERMADLVAERGAALVLMHMRGEPRTMQDNPVYDDVVSEVCDELGRAKQRALEAGIDELALAVDPGIGFGKTVEHNLSLIRRLERLDRLERPVLIGVSRKAFIGRVGGAPVQRRLMGTAAAVTAAILAGARIVRVHDVAELLQTVRLAEAIDNAD